MMQSAKIFQEIFFLFYENFGILKEKDIVKLKTFFLLTKSEIRSLIKRNAKLFKPL